MRKIQTIACIVVLVTQTVAEQKKTSVADMWIAAWNSHDTGKVVAAFSPDVRFEDVTFGATNHGSRELRKLAVSIFDAVPDAKFDLVNSSEDRRHGSIEWTSSGTDRGLYKTGKRFSVRGASVIELRGEKIARARLLRCRIDYEAGRLVALRKQRCSEITSKLSPENFSGRWKVDRRIAVKLIFVLFRRSDISHDESLGQWCREQHTSIVRPIPSLKKWIQNHAITLPSDAAADGIGELWFDSPSAMEQAMNSPQMAAAVEDAKRFLDMERTYALAVDEKIILNALE